MLIENTERAQRKAVLHLLGVSMSHFHALTKAGVFQPIERGIYNLPDCIKRWVRYHADGQSGSDMAEEKRLLIIAQRKQIEQRTRVESRELIPLDEVQQTFNAAMVLIGAQLDGLAGRLAGELAGLSDPAEVRSVLFHEVRRVRDAAADKLESWAADHTGSVTTETTTPEDTRSVGG